MSLFNIEHYYWNMLSEVLINETKKNIRYYQAKKERERILVHAWWDKESQKALKKNEIGAKDWRKYGGSLADKDAYKKAKKYAQSVVAKK